MTDLSAIEKRSRVAGPAEHYTSKKYGVLFFDYDVCCRIIQINFCETLWFVYPCNF